VCVRTYVCMYVCVSKMSNLLLLCVCVCVQVVALVWLLTAPLKFGPAKRMFRGLSLVIFVIVFLILFLSDREDQYQGEGDKIEAHDSFIVPRIAISTMMILSAIMSVIFLTFIHCSKVITVSFVVVKLCSHCHY
jgi:hypothetical protein